MHELFDENGNPIPHGGHGHEHEHGCGHTHCGSCEEGQESCRDETLALLTYMTHHNEQHAAEVDRMAAELEAKGMPDVAKQMRDGVSHYQKGNMYLSMALTMYREHLEEA